MANVVITGAAHGIGAALAERFARSGDAVALLDRDGEAASARAKALVHTGSAPLARRCDVTSEPECAEVIEELIDRWGGVDVLVNNAGITQVGLVRESRADVLRRVMDVNFFGAVHCTRAALPSLVSRRGQVAVLSSVAGFAPLATRAGYAASKHALHGFFSTLRAEHARDGLAVTLVCPSFVRTGIGSRALDARGRRAGEAARSGVGHEIEPGDAADRIFRGVRRRDRWVWVGREARLAWWTSQLFPALYERVMLRRTLG